jgi:hypothetical protein
MAIHRLIPVAAVLGLGTLLAIGTAGHTQQPEPPAQPAAAQQEGVEVLARGPIHEAFAEPIDNRPQQPGQVVPKKPPDPIPEEPPDQKPEGENVQWISGYWSWDEDRSDFIWVSGIWRVSPPARQWIPGHWIQVDQGWQWSPGFWLAVDQVPQQPQQQPQLQFLPPPPEPVQAQASVPAPNPNSVYVPGTWVYRETRYLWQPGYWLDYRPGWVWVPAHYVWTPAGYVFVGGYWDFELRRRGLLFAPVAFTQPLWARPAWFFRPRYVVYDDFLMGSLFIRPGYNHYYFGDYFEPAYRRRGFVSWLDFSVGRTRFDPLYSYYRWHYREDRHWERDLHTLYAARFRGEVPRPPRTLVQQNTLIQNITINKTVQVNNIRNVTALAPLTQVNNTIVKLQPVSREHHQEQLRAAQQLREVSRQRTQLESQLLAKGAVPIRTDKPRTVKLDLPQPRVPTAVSERHQPPPPPVSHVGTRPVTKPEAGRPAVPQPRPEVRPEVKPPSKPPVTPAKPEGRPPQPQPKPEVKPPQTAPRPEGRPPQPKPEGKPPVTPAKPEGKPPQTALKPEVRPPQPMPKPEVKPPQTALRPEVRPPQPQPQPRPEARPPSPPARPEVRPPVATPKPVPGRPPAHSHQPEHKA